MAPLVDRMQRFPALALPVLSVFRAFISRGRGLDSLLSFQVFQYRIILSFLPKLDSSSLVPGSNFSRLNVTFSTISSLASSLVNTRYEDFDSSRSLNF